MSSSKRVEEPLQEKKKGGKKKKRQTPEHTLFSKPQAEHFHEITQNKTQA